MYEFGQSPRCTTKELAFRERLVICQIRRCLSAQKNEACSQDDRCRRQSMSGAGARSWSPGIVHFRFGVIEYWKKVTANCGTADRANDRSNTGQ
jgi:hypothetical protein